MEKITKEQYMEIYMAEENFIHSGDISLTSTLGSIGYKVYVGKGCECESTTYKIRIKSGILEDINKYYQGFILVSTYLLAENLLALQSIRPSSTEVLKVPMKTYPVQEEIFPDWVK